MAHASSRRLLPVAPAALDYYAQARPHTGLGSKPLSALVDVYLPWLAKAPPILIAAAYIDSARSGEADEAIMLWNVGSRIEPLAGWQVESSGRRTSVSSDVGLSLAPGGRLWLAAEALAFRQSFGDPLPPSG